MDRSAKIARRHVRLLLFLAAAATAYLSAAAHLAAADRPTTKTSGSMGIRVVDKAGQPIDKAMIQVSVWTPEKDFKRRRFYRTDEQGRATIELPKSLEIVRVWARAKGYAPMFAQLWPQNPIDAHPLPEEFAYELTEGTTMGGVVTDDEGKPIRGARVEVRYDSGGEDGDTRPPAEYDAWLAEGISTKTTDADGRWQLDNVPPGADVQVRVKLRHRDYINDADWGTLQQQQRVTSEQLRDRSAAIVMHRGIVISGTVTDPQGNPVKNAVVIHGDRPYWEEGSQEVRTDKHGVYRFEPLPAGPMRITLVAKGWMPQMRKIKIAPDHESVDFRLQPGKKLRIQFVDDAGAAVPDVSVSIKRWRGVESLYTHRHSNVIDLQVPNKSDQDGFYEWTWAPDDAIDYVFLADGYARNEATLGPGDHVQTIHKALRIAGTVTDAATGQPLQSFRVVPVIRFRPEFLYLERRQAQDGRDGRFEMEFERTDIQHGVQIEAPGYVTFRTPRAYPVGHADPELTVRLQSTKPYLGTLVDADGQVVEGATVYVATHVQHLDLYNLKDRSSFSSNYGLQTDDGGQFEIAPQMDRYVLVAIAPGGYAEAERAADEAPAELRLQPWATISGRVIQNGKPMPGVGVYVNPIRVRGGVEPRVNSYGKTETDENGSFAFERAAPIACRVRPDLHFSVESPMKSSRSVPLDLKPGEDVTVELGGGGAEVTGRLALDEPRDDFDFHFSLSYLIAQKPGIRLPASLEGRGFDWRTGWSDSWLHSNEGAAYLLTRHTWFVKPDPDGKFRISGVEPGDYLFAVALYGTTEGCLVHPVAQRVVSITVQPGQRSLDVGQITVPTQPVPVVGDLAANFPFTAPDGRQTDLASQRGKYVLVDFWATWCNSCVKKMPEVEAVRNEFSGDGRLVVVGANLDAEQGTAERFLEKRPLPWHHALLGDWSATDVPKQYGVTSVPAYVLIDPDGKIAALEYSIDELAPKLKAALSD